MSHQNDGFSKFLHKPNNFGCCTYFAVHFEVQLHPDSRKNGCGHFDMLLYDNFSTKVLPRGHSHKEFLNSNVCSSK